MGLFSNTPKVKSANDFTYIKEKRNRYKALVSLVPDKDKARSGYGISWFKSQLFPLHWESSIHTCRGEESIILGESETKPMMIQVYASNKKELEERVNKVIELNTELVEPVYSGGKQSEWLEILESSVSISGQKEGGIR